MLFWIRELVMRNVSSFCLETVTPKDRVTSVVAFSNGGSKIDFFGIIINIFNRNYDVELKKNDEL